MGQLNLTDATELFKTKYAKLSENTYNSANILLARVKKSYNFTGKNEIGAVPTSFAGGVGSGVLPTVNNDSVDNYTLTRKKVYARAEIEREAIKAASSDEGAFVNATKWVVKRAVESYMRNCSRILFNDSSKTGGLGNGAVARGDGSTAPTGAGTTGSPYLLTLNADTVEAFVEEGDFLHYSTETGSANFLEVTDYNPTTRVVSLVGTSAAIAALVAGPTALSASLYLYMQNSKAKDPIGLGEVLKATTGTLYGVTVKRRWKAGASTDAAGAGITTDVMNQDVLEIDRKSGKTPNLIVASFTQYRKILNLMEDKKYIDVQPRSEALKGVISFKALEFMTSAGPIPIVADRFMVSSEIFYLNDNFIEIKHAPDFGWFDDDGTIFLRKADDDAYEARYGGYWQTLVSPLHQGIRYGLAT
jgi:hypothetical protein